MTSMPQKQTTFVLLRLGLTPKEKQIFKLMKGHLLMHLMEEVKVVPHFLCKLEKCHKKEQ